MCLDPCSATVARGTVRPFAPGHHSHPIFAALYDAFNATAEHFVLRHLRDELLTDLHGRVLEIGVGTGANFAHYPLGCTVVATDPEPHMLARALAHLGRSRVPVEFHACSTESLPFADGTFDAVVSTMVLCSVDDVAASLAEVRRVLAPRGELRYLEHVRYDDWRGRVQDVFAPVWCRLAGGCHIDRCIVAAIRGAGFDIGRERRSGFLGTPLQLGVATRLTPP
jgi:SAM-dependent methyltransferase